MHHILSTSDSSPCVRRRGCDCNARQRIATHCITLQHTATTHCNTLQHAAQATHCNRMQRTLTHPIATPYRLCQPAPALISPLATNTPQVHCITLQHTATHRNTFLLIAMPYRLCWSVSALVSLLAANLSQLHCTTLPNTATQRHTLQHTATALQQDCNNTATHAYSSHCDTVEAMSVSARFYISCNALQHTATHCNTLQHTATHCIPALTSPVAVKSPQYTATQYKTPQHTENIATHCNTLQHTATHCNTLQHIPTHCNTLQAMPVSARSLISSCRQKPTAVVGTGGTLARQFRVLSLQWRQSAGA